MSHDAQMLKGVLSLLLLSLLGQAEGYGYSIVTRLKAAGFEDLAEGTVYPALTRWRQPACWTPGWSARPPAQPASTTAPPTSAAPSW